MRRQFFLLVISAVFLFCLSILSRWRTEQIHPFVVGIVRDSESAKPVAGAKIRFINTDKNREIAISNSKGEFRIMGTSRWQRPVLPLHYTIFTSTLECAAQGFISDASEIRLTRGSVTSFDNPYRVDFSLRRTKESR